MEKVKGELKVSSEQAEDWVYKYREWHRLEKMNGESDVYTCTCAIVFVNTNCASAYIIELFVQYDTHRNTCIMRA